jgi:hypothetical protein
VSPLRAPAGSASRSRLGTNVIRPTSTTVDM